MCFGPVGVDDIAPLIPIIPTIPNLPGFPWQGPFILEPEPDYSNVDKKDDIEKPQTRLEELEGSGYKKDPANVIVEDFSGVTFDGTYNNFKNALEPYSALHETSAWGDVRNAIVEAIQNFKIGLGTLEQTEEAWKGKTHDAALQNLETSYPEPTTAADGAGVQGILEDAFIRTISATKQNIEDNKGSYDAALRDFPEYDSEIKQRYDTFAYNVMKDVYRPNIVQIGKDNPAFTAGVKLDVGPDGPGPDGPGPFGPGSTGPGSFGAGDLPGPPSTPKLPEFDTPKLPETPDTPTFPTQPPGEPTLPQSLGQPTAPSPTSQGAGQPTSGANRPPEGVLGLGPKGLGGAGKGASRGGGAGGKAGGGAGARLPRGLAPGNATATPAAAVRGPAAGGGAGAGLGAMGPPGAGAPAAGAAGRDGNNSHQVLKALRRKKTGQQVAGEAEAVVPVVGAPEKPVKPGTNQSDQAAQPDPDPGGVRSVSQPPQGSEQSTRVPGQ